MKTSIATILVVLFTFGAVEASKLDLKVEINPEINRAIEFRIANDEWDGPDKHDHLIVGIGTMALSSVLWKASSDDDVWSMAGKNILGWAIWEAKDAIWRWEDHGWFGGDGFSTKDLVWSAGGVVSMALVVIWLR